MAVGISAKIAPAATEGATVAPEAGGEADAFAQMLAGAGTAPKAPGEVAGAALLAKLAVGQAGGEGEADAKAAPATEGAEQAVCMIQLADLAARMLARGTAEGGKIDKESDSETEAEGEGDAPSAEDEASAVTLALALAAGLTQPPQPALHPIVSNEPKGKLPAPIMSSMPTQISAATIPAAAAKTDDEGQSEKADAEAQPLSLIADKLMPTLPQPLRNAFKAAMQVRGGPEPLKADAAGSTIASTADAAAATPAPFTPFTGSSIQALMQSQLGATATADASAAVDKTGTAHADLSIERQLDIAQDSDWLDGLAKDIARTADRDGTMRFRLNPETLGTLRVEVSQSHAGTAVRLTADTEAARQIIADAQPRLIAEARAQGVRIAETHVGMDNGSQNQAADQRRQSEARQQTFVRTAAEAEVESERASDSAPVAAERFA